MERRRCEPVKPAREPTRRTPADPSVVYTVREVADRLKVSPGTVRNMIDEGQLYAVRLHKRRIVVPKWALDELVARPSTVVDLTRRASNA
ncbi:MAG: helix-turn-helix domain-containing protein [Nocardioidaceae bacterium]